MTPERPELDVYVPRLDLYEVENIAAYLRIPPGAAIIGSPTEDPDLLALHFQPRSTSATWADQMHEAAKVHRGGGAPPLALPAALFQHVGTYDQRDGTITVDDTWDARRAARAWLGRGRRELVEELYTTGVPEHPQRRVILFNVRNGDVPQSVRAYAHRQGEDRLIEQMQPAAAAPAPRPLGEDTRVVQLTPGQVEEIAAALHDSARPVDGVELRRHHDGGSTYRLHYADGQSGPWRNADPVRVAPAAERAAASARRPTMGHQRRAMLG